MTASDKLLRENCYVLSGTSGYEGSKNWCHSAVKEIHFITETATLLGKAFMSGQLLGNFDVLSERQVLNLHGI
jgi:hypothetical protein